MSTTQQLKKETKKREFDQITFKRVLDETRKSNFGMSKQLFCFVIVTLLSLILAYVLPYSLFITFPFLIIPSYFSFTSVNAAKSAKDGEGANFIHLFKTYYAPIFFGGYRLLIGYLKAIGVYIVSNALLITIFERTILKNNEAYNALIEKIQTSTDLNALVDDLINLLNNNQDIQKFIILASTIATFLATLVFIHHIAKHSIKMRRNLFFKNFIPMRHFNFVEKRVRNANISNLRKTYLRTAWFIKLLLVLAGASGIILSFFFLKEFTLEKTFIISLFLMFVVTIPFLNYISKLQDLIYIALANEYEETYIHITFDLLSKYKDKIGIKDDEFKKLTDILSLHEKENEENKEDKKEDEDK